MKEFIKDKIPFAFNLYLSFYAMTSNALRWFCLLLPLKIRLQMGMEFTLKDKKSIMQKLYRQRKELPLFLGKRVLCWEPAPWPVHIAMISSVGTALSLRGCSVELVVCDGAPVACIGRDISENESLQNWDKRSPGCYKACKDEANSFGLKTVAIGDIIDTDKLSELRRISQKVDLREIASYVYKGVNVGTYAASSLTRYYRGKVIEFEEELLREHLFSALVILEAAAKKIDSFEPDAIYMSHGLYTSWGPAWEIAMKRRIPVVRIGGGYRRQYTYFRKIADLDTVETGVLSDRGWKERNEKALSLHEERILDDYLTSRYEPNFSGFADVKVETRVESKHDILSKLQMTDDKPIWCIFTHSIWDDSVSMSKNMSRLAFYDYTEWTEETLRTIIDITDVQWIVRIHPTEKRGDNVEGVENIINDMFPNLPPHIKVIPPEANINTYSIFNIITGGVTCRGTVGLEIAVTGKPVILAGGAYYSRKGFTYEGLSANEYKDLLRKTSEIPPFLTPEQKGKARKFAYSYYIQRQIPLRMFKTGSNGRFALFDWRKVESLLPDRDPVVDMICERFFVGDDFVLPDEVIRDVVRL